MVLLQLAWNLRARTELRVNLTIPLAVREQVKETHDSDWYRTDYSGIVLLDDPLRFEAIPEAVSKARRENVPIVFAIDPTQWADKHVREKFQKLIQMEEIIQYNLQHAYRQGGEIGKNILELITHYQKNSSFRADAYKVQQNIRAAEFWHKVCLEEVTFADDAGHLSIAECDSVEDLQEVLANSLEVANTFNTYKNWRKFLFGYPSRVCRPRGFKSFTSRLEDEFSFTYKERAFEKADDIRGAEFENVVVFISKSDWKSLRSGTTSKGTNDWERLVNILTFLTRAENQLLVVVLPEDFPSENSLGASSDASWLT
jgi:hypothetical protein